jgi:hypothetical protein
LTTSDAAVTDIEASQDAGRMATLRNRPPFRKPAGISIHSQSGARQNAMRCKRLSCANRRYAVTS